MRAIAPRLIRLQEYGGIAPDGPDIVHKDVRHRNQVHQKSRRRGDLDEQVPASLRGQNQLQYRRHEDAMYLGKLSGPTREAVDIFGARGSHSHRLGLSIRERVAYIQEGLHQWRTNGHVFCAVIALVSCTQCELWGTSRVCWSNRTSHPP